MKDGQWMYHTGSSEMWNEGEYFDTKDEAILAGKEAAKDYGYEQFEVGQLEVFVPFIDASGVIEQIQEDAYEECSEAGEDYLNDVLDMARDELEEKLNEVLDQWIDKYNLKPCFYRVNYTEAHEV